MTTGFAVLIGLGLGCSLIVLVSATPAWRRPSLATRLSPYLPSTVIGNTPVRTPQTPGRWSLLLRMARIVDRWAGGAASVRHRLDRLGRVPNTDQFRIEQLTWALAGVAVAVALLALRSATVGFPGPEATVAVLGIAAVTGFLGRDRWLSRQVTTRENRMRTELPTIAELLALSVAAGESAGAAIERISRVAHGELATEFSRAVAAMRSGTPMVESLEAMSQRVDVAELHRFVAGVAVAVDRGTPLSGVLQAQAAEVRETERRELIEIGGRKDILMMIPVVFLVLPLSVLFALFPGFYGISLGSP